MKKELRPKHKTTIKVISIIFSSLALFQSVLVRAEGAGGLVDEYISRHVSYIMSKTTYVKVDSKARYANLQYNFPFPGEISPFFNNSLIKKDSDTNSNQKLDGNELVNRINSWSAVLKVIAKTATQVIPGAELLRVLSPIENDALANRLSTSTMSASDWAVAAIPPFTLVAIQGTINRIFRKTSDLNGGKIFITHNNNLYSCHVSLLTGTELIPKVNTPSAHAKINQLVNVSIREAPLYSLLRCSNRITQYTKEIPNPRAVSQTGYKEISKLIARNKRSDLEADWRVSDNVEETLLAPTFVKSFEIRVRIKPSQLQRVMSPEDYFDLRSRIKIFSVQSLDIF